MTTHWFQYIAQVPLCLSAILHTACTDVIIAGDTRPMTPGMTPEPGGPGLDPDHTPTTSDADGSSGALSTSGADTSGGDETTGTTGATGGSGVCGDGVVDDGEDCDDGTANSDAGACTEDCAANVCGDGKLLVGVEDCDAGPGNSDVYGSPCGTDCTPAAKCGDGVVQPEAGEECEPDDGGDGQDCDAGCHAFALRGFITSAAYMGDLGGLDGADATCRELATAGGLSAPENFRAFLGSADVSALERFAARLTDPRPYVLPGGLQFAASFAELVAGGPADIGISITEQGDPLVEARVATNTDPDGSVHLPETSCASWLSADKDLKAHLGLNALASDNPDLALWQSEGWWVDRELLACDKAAFHLYCLE